MTDEPTLTGGPTLPLGQGRAADEIDFLSTPAENSEDLELMLAARPPRRKLPKVTLLLATGAMLGVGFAGGVEAQKHLGTSSSSSSGFAAIAAALRGSRTSGGTSSSGSSGRSGFAGLLGNATVGSVVLVDGSTVYVSSSGGIVKVTTTPSTKVSVTQSGSVAQLEPGQTIVVEGSKTSTGTVSATSISEGSFGAGLGGGGTGGASTTGGGFGGSGTADASTSGGGGFGGFGG